MAMCRASTARSGRLGLIADRLRIERGDRQLVMVMRRADLDSQSTVGAVRPKRGELAVETLDVGWDGASTGTRPGAWCSAAPPWGGAEQPGESGSISRSFVFERGRAQGERLPTLTIRHLFLRCAADRRAHRYCVQQGHRR